MKQKPSLSDFSTLKYTFIFWTLGSLLIILSIKYYILSWLFLWSSISFILVGIAYAGLGAKIFGKKANGKISKLSLVILLPYLLLTWITWHLQRWLSTEDCCNEITPGIWLGRRAFLKELPENIDLIVDLTAEFSEPSHVIIGKTYICIPTLDTSAPQETVFKELIQKILVWDGNVYIHCALGHGRSATVAAGVLLAKGIVNDFHQAEKVLLTIRPRIKFSQVQKKLLKKMSRVL
ncbi:MAG TPA: hypothetical protein DDZ80_06825 [Cyanobacteria bacterium UBA8803]|nr:hypothetical protein [Cyanobacteria bacterium UBA9273]HBL58235.1 hypothetical protein [Cyanobacteria bacterium UBA8803]